MSRLVVSIGALALALAACEPAPVVGASCMYPADCRRPLVCRFDRCRNECTRDADCPAGATCLFDARGHGACGVAQDIGCERGARCDDALACILDRCRARCIDSSDCAADGVCAAPMGVSTRVCFRADDELPDGGGSDAHVTDAGATDAGDAS